MSFMTPHGSSHHGLLALLLCLSLAGFSQETPQPSAPPVQTAKKWYDQLSIRGYTQIRYNRLLETNSDLGCEQCDRSWGNNGGFFIRRMRIVLYGQITKKIYVYIQPDLASSPSSDRLHFAQIRDTYFDIGIDAANEFRVRLGQSKVPFGFENTQSSQNRLALDRNDALNSAVANERDLGAFFYWAPKAIRTRFSELVSTGLKGSGDYGVFGIGLYNGQTANAPELNNALHAVARLSYPFKLKEQIVEAGIQAYTGQYVLPAANLSSGVRYHADRSYLDQRAAASVTLYPKPFGLQAEYNVGRGPEFDKATDSITLQRLHGGYLLLSYRLEFQHQILFPFVRAQYYDGGKKHERDARSYEVKELEMGMEWQPTKQLEFTLMYSFSHRRYEDFQKQDNLQTGQLLRIQAQVNY